MRLIYIFEIIVDLSKMPNSSSKIRSQNLISKDSSGEQSLPSYIEYEVLNKRIEFMETSMMKIQKRVLKMEKKNIDQNQFQEKIKKELLEQIIRQNQNGKLDQRELEEAKDSIEQIRIAIKKVQKKVTEINRQIVTISSISHSKADYELDDKLQQSFIKNKTYIDKAVNQLKAILKEYVKQQAQLQQKISIQTPIQQLVKSNQKSRVSVNSNGQGQGHRSKRMTEQKQSERYEDTNSVNSPKNSNSSRVSYLREKLKEFQQINKKYQGRIEPKIINKEDEVKAVQKMKDFRDYLEQSESELDPSVFENSQNNILTDSLTKWRSMDKHFPSMEKKK